MTTDTELVERLRHIIRTVLRVSEAQNISPPWSATDLDGVSEAAAAIERLTAERDAAQSKLVEAVAIVNEQANDDGLWFIEQLASEAYLQQALRRLHAAIEGISPDDSARGFLATMEPDDAP